MNRRSFLQSILAAGVAPAVVGSGVLMPVRASRILHRVADIIPYPAMGQGVFTRASVAYVWDAEGKMFMVGENVPRPGLLMEPQRFNYVLSDSLLTRVAG